MLVAHEHHRGDVEGQFLHGGVEQEPRVVGRPVRDDAGGDVVDVLDVAGQPGAGEGLLHDAAVEHVFLEVEHHQAAVEERADDRMPALLGVVLVAVGEDGLGRVGAECDDRRQDRRVGEGHRSAGVVEVHGEVRAGPEHLDDVTEQGQSRVAGDGLEVAARWRFGQRVLFPLVLQQALLEQSHAGNGVDGGREAAFGLVEKVGRGADGRLGHVAVNAPGGKAGVKAADCGGSHSVNPSCM